MMFYKFTQENPAFGSNSDTQIFILRGENTLELVTKFVVPTAISDAKSKFVTRCRVIQFLIHQREIKIRESRSESRVSFFHLFYLLFLSKN